MGGRSLSSTRYSWEVQGGRQSSPQVLCGQDHNEHVIRYYEHRCIQVAIKASADGDMNLLVASIGIPVLARLMRDRGTHAEARPKVSGRRCWRASNYLAWLLNKVFFLDGGK